MKPFRVLCLDGGGMRGVYQAAYLHAFASRVCGGGERELDVGRCFDLIVGTSTGGIVASALAAGEPLSKVDQLYGKHGKDIFPYQWLRRMPVLWRLVPLLGMGIRQGEEALRRALEDTLRNKTFRFVQST